MKYTTPGIISNFRGGFRGMGGPFWTQEVGPCGRVRLVRIAPTKWGMASRKYAHSPCGSFTSRIIRPPTWGVSRGIFRSLSGLPETFSSPQASLQ